ncbi:TerC family protein [Verrucomicrobium sp. BvORR106]|uniref:TerC family protein n=1 Tax=Verrucomicrobium sp. BvORR106 TaxID=1403819 RepID=UPI00056DB119|nr:TerC family protein [Verrucomicrobium sp. BvORR106]
MTPIWWFIFSAFVLGMLALDLGVFHRKAHVVKVKEALTWTAIWVALALLFSLGIATGFVGAYPEGLQQQASLEFLSGYVLEKSLSVDNVFVFALLFAYFKVPQLYQHRVLFWGILGALVMRAVFIFAGVALIERFHWILYIFGVILIVSGVKMWMSKDVEIDPATNPVLRLTRRLLPVSETTHGQDFFVRQGGKLLVTPLFVVLIFVEWSDLVFAVDSIPAVLAVSRDPFIVFTSNVFAILGLRSLYFALSGVMDRFHMLHYGLSAILAFVGVKMLIVDFYKVPIGISLAVITVILAVSVVTSFYIPAKKSETEPVADGEGPA